jgi:hypothetical protein
MSIKDLRGPAQAEVIQPSNWLIRMGLAGFLGWLALLVMILIARYLPVRPDPAEGTTGDSNRPMAIIGPGFSAASGGSGGGGRMGGGPGGPMPGPGAPGIGGGGPSKPSPKGVKEEPGVFEFLGVQLMPFVEEAAYFWVTLLVFLIPGLVYSGALTYGAVKMQSLESRTWGIVSSIMAMLPFFNSGGLLVMLLMFVQVLILLIFDDATIFLIALVVIQWLASAAVGLWALMVCNSEDVVAGFEFDPDA